MEIQYTANTPLLTYYEYWRLSPDGCVFARDKNPFPAKTLSSPIFSKAVGEITYDEIEAYLKREHNNGLSLGSIRRYQGFFNQIFRKAVSEGLIEKNPYASMRYIPSLPPNHKLFTSSELDAIMKCLKCRAEGNLYALIRYTGIFREEAVLLKWSDVSFEEKQMHIRKPGKGEIDAEFEKYSRCRVIRGADRIIPLSQDAIKVLEDEKSAQEKRLITLSRISPDDSIDRNELSVFTDNYGKSYDLYEFPRVNKWVQERTGILDFGTERLRIHFCLELLQAGVDLKTMSQISGLRANTTVFGYLRSHERIERQKRKEAL